MRVEVNPVDSYDQERAEIYVVKVTQDIQSAIDTLDNNCRVISVFDKEKTLICRTD